MKRVLIILAIVIGLVIIALASLSLYLFQANGLERIVNNQLNERLPETSPYIITIGSIDGSLLSGAELRDVVVKYKQNDDTVQLVDIYSLRAEYTLTGLLRAEYAFGRVVLDSFTITVVEDTSGGFVGIPAPSGTPQGESELAATISDLVLRRGTIHYVTPAESTVVTDLRLQAELSLRDNTLAGDLTDLAFSSSRPGIWLSHASGQFTVADQRLVVRRFTVAQDRARVTLDGAVNLSDLAGQLNFDANSVDLQLLDDLIGFRIDGLLDVNGSMSFIDNELEAALVIGGDLTIFSFNNLYTSLHFANDILTIDTVYGSFLRGSAIDGRGMMDFSARPELYELQAELSQFDLQQLVPGAFPTRINGMIDLDGEAFSEDQLLLTATVQLTDSYLDRFPLHTATGSLAITVDSVVLADSFRVSYFENRFAVGGSVVYDGPIDLRVSGEWPNLERWRGALFIDRPAGRANAEFRLTGATADPNLSGWLRSDSLWLYGFYADSFFATADIDQFLDNRSGSVRADAYRGSVWGLPADSIRARLQVDSARVRIDTLVWRSDPLDVMTEGDIDNATATTELDLRTVRLRIGDRTLANRTPVRFGIDSNGFRLDRVELGTDSSRIGVDGRVEYNETANLDLFLDQEPIQPWLRLYDTSIIANGLLSGDARLTGTLLDPTMFVDLRLDSAVVDGLDVGTILALAHYDRRRVTVDSLFIQSRDQTSTSLLQGTLPIDLALTTAPVERLPDEPIDISIVMNQRDLGVVPWALPEQVEELSGLLQADVRISGTPQSPQLAGDIRLTDGQLKYIALQEEIAIIDVEANLTNNVIAVRDSAFLHRGSLPDTTGDRRSWLPGFQPIFLAGEITVEALDTLNYDLRLWQPQPTRYSYDLDDISAEVGAMRVSIRGSSPPLIDGLVSLNEVRYEVPFADADEPTAIDLTGSDETSWNFDIDFNAPGRLFVRNEDIDAEFRSVGLLNVKRTRGRPLYAGQMEVVRGRVFLFDKTLRLDPGGSVNYTDVERPNPRIDLTARFNVPVQTLDGSRATSREGIVSITGTLEEPEITAAVGSELSLDEMLRYLVTNTYTSDSVQATSSLEARIAGFASAQISQFAAAQIGVETLEIVPGQNSASLLDPRITAGTYIAEGRVYVYGDIYGGETYGAEVRLSQDYFLEARQTEDELWALILRFYNEF